MIKPFVRTVWASETARALWAPAVNTCAYLTGEMEIKSVAAGHRRCAWQTIPEASLPGFTQRCAEVGLIVYPVHRVGRWDGFIHYTPAPDPERLGNLYCIVARTLEDAKEFAAAFASGDHVAQGHALGFPDCCCRFFARNWKAQVPDPIWEWGGETSEVIEAHPYANPLLRYIGVRGGFHIPCSPNCEGTIAVVSERMTLLEKSNRIIMSSLLSMPMSWDALNGIAIVRTPIFHVITSTGENPERRFLSVNGSFLPKEGAPGLVFPHTLFNNVSRET